MRRLLLGICGSPGAGKTSLAEHLVATLPVPTAHVPLDGFHLADVELSRQGLLGRKGAPETFDAHGYAALLARLRSRPAHAVYAPGFDRHLEQPLAGAIRVGEEVDVVVTEGNYLLLDEPAWASARESLDQVWFVSVAEDLRLERLVARHVRFGKSPDRAEAWVREVDEPNARRVEECRPRADRSVDLTGWVPGDAGSLDTDMERWLLG